MLNYVPGYSWPRILLSDLNTYSVRPWMTWPPGMEKFLILLSRKKPFFTAKYTFRYPERCPQAQLHCLPQLILSMTLSDASLRSDQVCRIFLSPLFMTPTTKVGILTQMFNKRGLPKVNYIIYACPSPWWPVFSDSVISFTVDLDFTKYVQWKSILLWQLIDVTPEKDSLICVW